MNQVLDGGISEIKRKVCFQLIEHSCSRAIAEYWRHQNNMAVYTINRECNCKRQNVMEISGRTSIFIDVKPFMRSWKPGVGKNQPPNHHHSDGHYWFCPKLTRVLVSLGKFFPLFKDRILGKIFWNIPGNLSAKKWIYLLYILPCCINLINVVMALTKPTSDFVWNIWPRHFFFAEENWEHFLFKAINFWLSSDHSPL